MSRLNSLIISILSLVVFSCSSSESKEEASDQLGHEKMVKILAKLPQELDPEQNIYLNSQRISLYEERKSTGPDSIKNEIIIAQEYLYAGKNKEAISRLESLQTFAPKELLYLVGDLLAISYLRLAEQENCIDNHHSQSCILPITEAGVHQLKENGEKCISQCLKLLQEKPEDQVVIWILNLAHMTIGSYPDQVPKAYLLPPSFMNDRKDFPRFAEIAMDLGLAEVGLSGGSIIEDLDNDGDLDLAASSWGLNDQFRIYLQQESGKYESTTKGIEGITGGLNVVTTDYNNDGLVDIYILRGAWMGKDGKHPNSLLKNNGDGSFTDVTFESGLFTEHPTQTADWADFDLDGDLDLFVGNESTQGSQHYCQLFVNDGTGKFEDQAGAYGLKIAGFIKGAQWGDFNNDLLPDLYLSRMDGPNLLFQNNGSGNKFKEVGRNAAVVEPLVSFPCWFWDYNNDGFEDIFVSGYQTSVGELAKEFKGISFDGERPRLYLNNQDGTFTDKHQMANLDKVLFTMGSNYGDLNNDGFLDFYVGTGDPDFRSIMPNRMFLNSKGARFEEVSYAGGFAHLQKGHGVSFGDLDNDGDQEVFAVMGGALEGDIFANSLFDNPGFDNNWVKLKLHGEHSNRLAIGARVHVITEEGRNIFRTVDSGGSFGVSSYELHIGLEKSERIKQLKIRWPFPNSEQSFTDLDINQKYVISENKGIQSN